MSIPPPEIWRRVQADLETTLSHGMFSIWIRPAELVSWREVGENHAIVGLSSSTTYHVHELETRYYAHIKEALDRVTGKQCELEFIQPNSHPLTPSVKNSPTLGSFTPPLFELPNTGATPTTLSTVDAPTQSNSLANPQNTPTYSGFPPESTFPQHLVHTEQPVNPAYKMAVRRAGMLEDYTFDTFAVSTSNEMAHAAAVAVSQNPGSAYNPLFLYGGVGVGKTHLMQAIGHNILRQNPDISLGYITGEQFTNEIVAAIQQKKTIQLKQRFRGYRVLLMDDIQFIAGKDSVQEEFFHTFNAIVPQGGQVILTSDRPPHEMDLLEDRLRSRFEAGLIIDIQQPSFELRTAILLIKARKIGLNLPMELAQKIASAVESTRKLEGILAKLHSETTLFRKPISATLIEEILGKVEQAEFPKQRIKPGDVIKTISAQFHISVNSLKGPSRNKELVFARHMAMYILYEDLRSTLEDIGMLFGGRDHSSVLHAVQKMKLLIPQDETTRTQLAAIKTSLSSYT